MNEKVKRALAAYKKATTECAERAEALRLARLVVSAAQDEHFASHQRMMLAQDALLEAARDELRERELLSVPETVEAR